MTFKLISSPDAVKLISLLIERSIINKEMLSTAVGRFWPMAMQQQLTRSFAKKLQKKPPKEKKYGIAVTDEKMIKLTTKEDSKVAEQLRVVVYYQTARNGS